MKKKKDDLVIVKEYKVNEDEFYAVLDYLHFLDKMHKDISYKKYKEVKNKNGFQKSRAKRSK